MATRVRHPYMHTGGVPTLRELWVSSRDAAFSPDLDIDEAEDDAPFWFLLVVYAISGCIIFGPVIAAFLIIHVLKPDGPMSPSVNSNVWLVAALGVSLSVMAGIWLFRFVLTTLDRLIYRSDVSITYLENREVIDQIARKAVQIAVQGPSASDADDQ